MHFKHEIDRNLAKNWKKLRIKWNFELTVFELTVPDLYIESNSIRVFQIICSISFCDTFTESEQN